MQDDTSPLPDPGIPAADGLTIDGQPPASPDAPPAGEPPEAADAPLDPGPEDGPPGLEPGAAATPEADPDPAPAIAQEDPADLALGVDTLHLRTLRGDLRDAMLLRFRQAPKPWARMSQDEQQDVANGMELAAAELVRRAVQLVTSFPWPTLAVHLGDVAIKHSANGSRVEAKVVAENTAEARDVMGEHSNSQVMLVAIDSASFMGVRGPAQVDPDQAGLPLDAPPKRQTAAQVQAAVDALAPDPEAEPSADAGTLEEIREEAEAFDRAAAELTAPPKPKRGRKPKAAAEAVAPEAEAEAQPVAGADFDIWRDGDTDGAPVAPLEPAEA